MTLPKDSVMSNDTKKYLKKSLMISTAVIIIIFLFTIYLTIHIISNPVIPTDNQTAAEMRKLNNVVIAAQQKQDEEQRKSAELSKKKDAELTSALLNIHKDLSTYKKQSNEKINTINSFKSADIVREFSELENEFNYKKR